MPKKDRSKHDPVEKIRKDRSFWPKGGGRIA